MSYTRVLLAGVCAVSLMACSDSGSTDDDAAPTTAAPITTGACTVLTLADVDALYGAGFQLVDSPDINEELTCVWDVETIEGGLRGGFSVAVSGLPYVSAIEASTELGHPIVLIDTLDAAAHFTSDLEEDQYWVTVDVGNEQCVTASVRFKNGAAPPSQDVMIAALSDLATRFIAYRNG